MTSQTVMLPSVITSRRRKCHGVLPYIFTIKYNQIRRKCEGKYHTRYGHVALG